jgi:hypothetical protein
MNERIKQLGEQAGIYNLNLVDETEYWILEKFAELLVSECADFVSNDRQNDDYGVFVANRIKQHFGVEE